MDVPRRSTLDLSNEKINFQGRLERLDWKRIASIDIDNLVQEGDTSQLLELICSVTFCKADSEFDHGRIDPGFIKVFRLSQLISEYLLASQEKYVERLTALEQKYNETEKEKVKLSEENIHLKESLTSAKKELKKRKEMIASTQSEILGQNNGDEYDQCPYCSKKFLTSGYLLAHIQRRHQGLPVNPLYPSLPPGGTSMAMLSLHHSHQHQQQQQLLTSNPPQGSKSGNYDSPGIVPPSPYHTQAAAMGIQLAIHVPSSTFIHGINPFSQSNNNSNINQSYSGSVTSLNQVHLTTNDTAIGNNQTVNAGGLLSRRDSFTQTSIGPNDKRPEQKPASSLGQVPEDLSYPGSPEFRQNRQESSNTAKDEAENTHPLCGDGGGGDGGSEVGSRSWKRVLEETEMNVMRMQDELQTRCKNLEEKNKDDTERNVSQKNLREEGEITKSPASVIINQAHSLSGDMTLKRQEIEELKNLLQASVQDEIKSLISRLESQEQFWQDKLASVQENHEKQIQQVRQELQLQNSSTTNKPNYSVQDITITHPAVLNADTIVGDGTSSEHENTDDEYEHRENESYPSGFIIVGPKGSHKQEKLLRHQIEENRVIGAQRDSLFPGKQDDIKDGGESGNIPVAKPRRSQGKEENKSHPGLSHGRGTAAAGTVEMQEQLQSLSESEAEYLTIIQPEEFHEERGRNSNSIISKKHPPGNDTITAVVAANTKKDQRHQNYHQQQRQLPISKYEAEGVTGAEIKSDDEVNDDDEVSDYTLSESVLGLDDEENGGVDEENVFRSSLSFQKKKNDTKFVDHPRGKSSVKQTPVKEKKRIIFDAQARKLVEASSSNEDEEDDDDDDEDDHSGKNDDLNNSSSAGDDHDDDDDDEHHHRRHSGRRGKKKKSQLDLVRAKTMMELEQGMTDIGLNPESTAIGLEEMGRALKHLKLQRRTSSDQIHDYKKFEEERNAVKTLAKFEATKSSIDGKLEAISTLNTKKTERSSLGKMFSAVKTSGKKFKKRVTSAVKKKQKSEAASDEEDHSEDDKKRKRKPSSAPPALKTTFFSKARWTRKKKGDDASTKKSDAGTAGKTGDEKVQVEGNMGNNPSFDSGSSSEESGEEIELSPFFTRSRPILRGKERDSMRSLERHNSTKKKNSKNCSRSRSGSLKTRGKTTKPLKRLNSKASSNNHSNNNNPAMSINADATETLSSTDDEGNERKGGSDDGHHNKVEEKGKYDNDDHVRPLTRRQPSNSHSSESSPFSNVDDYENDDDNDYDEGRDTYGNNEETSDAGTVQVQSALPSLRPRNSRKDASPKPYKVKRWDDGESDERLEEIKRIVDESKKDFGSDEDDDEEDYEEDIDTGTKDTAQWKMSFGEGRMEKRNSYQPQRTDTISEYSNSHSYFKTHNSHESQRDGQTGGNDNKIISSRFILPNSQSPVARPKTALSQQQRRSQFEDEDDDDDSFNAANTYTKEKPLVQKEARNLSTRETAGFLSRRSISAGSSGKGDTFTVRKTVVSPSQTKNDNEDDDEDIDKDVEDLLNVSIDDGKPRKGQVKSVDQSNRSLFSIG